MGLKVMCSLDKYGTTELLGTPDLDLVKLSILQISGCVIIRKLAHLSNVSNNNTLRLV